MDIAALRSFVAICRTGSFRRAARELHVSQPGVSRHVQRLEAELGVRVLVRGRRGILPTAAGSRLFAHALEAIAAHDRIVAALVEDDGPLQGELRIAASTTPGEYLLPRLLSDFTELYPQVRPHVLVTDSAGAIAQVEGGASALGFVGMRAPHADLESHLVAEDELVLAVPGRHPFAGRASVDVQELRGLPLIEREPGSGAWAGFRRALERAGVPHPGYRPVMTVNSTHATLAAVHSGLGFSVVSSLAVREHSFDQVHPARLTGLDTRRSLYLVHRVPLGPAVVRSFAGWVRTRLAQDLEAMGQRGGPEGPDATSPGRR